MAPATEEFARQLRALGLEPISLSETRLTFSYLVPVGTFATRELTLGFDVPPDFDRTPPSGPHISPRLLPLDPNAPGHPARVANSPFGDQFEYWSRPYQEWGKDGRTVSAYMAFIRHLFATV